VLPAAGLLVLVAVMQSGTLGAVTPPALAAQATGAEFPRALKGVRNARELAGYRTAGGDVLRSRVVARSGALLAIDPAGLEALRAYGIVRVVDLRVDDEFADQGADPPPFGRKPVLVRLPVRVESMSADWRENYRNLWLENAPALRAFLELLADPANHPLLVHGSAGTDRTGIFAAMLLELAGVERKVIREEHRRTDGSRTIDPAWLDEVFAIWDAHQAGLPGWLEENADVEPSVLRAVRHHLLSATPLAEPAEEAEAREQLAAAEALGATGKYARAVAGYAKLAKALPDTTAGRVAARRSQPNALVGWQWLVQSGPPENRVDIVLLGDGYLLKKQASFDKLAERMPKEFERHSVFGEYFSYHNFLRGNLASEEDGVDMGERSFSTALNSRASDFAQGQVTADHKLVHDYLAQLPHQDGLAIVFVRAGSLGTGGGGVAVIGGGPSNTVFHEWGHAFGGLMDEYSSDVGYTGGVRSGVNVTNSPDLEQLPWKHWIDAGRKGVGAFEGAAGRAKGAWKAMASGCAMASGRDFCAVCAEALVLRIYGQVDPIDAAAPAPHPLADEDPFADPVPPLAADAPLDFAVTVMRPATHALQVRWWVLPEDRVPPAPSPVGGRRRYGDRRDRGPLAVIEEPHQAETRADRDGTHTFTFDPKGLRPGRYRVIARAVDDTRLSGEDWPWVLHDPHHLLRSERGWWVVVER